MKLPHCKMDPRCPPVRAHDVAQCASGQEQCRAVQGGAHCVPTDIRQHSAAATALAPPSTATAVVVWLPPRAHLWSPAVRAWSP